jgi:hypothetical protein
MKNRDIIHLNILSGFHYLVGVYFLLTTLFVSRYVLAGIIAFMRSNGTASPSESFTSWGQVVMISTLVIFMVAMGIAILLAGHYLRKQKARIYCSVIAGIECLAFPLGTLLGVFTLIKLNKDSVNQLFANKKVDSTAYRRHVT